MPWYFLKEFIAIVVKTHTKKKEKVVFILIVLESCMSSKNEETGTQIIFSKGKQINENYFYIHIWNIFRELLDRIDTTTAVFS